ncbi:MAG: HIT domain-containing protein [Fimbriimonadaceae bacterium]|nr:HIT domain-containing protein [Fimbriimonadaceae bacterium]
MPERLFAPWRFDYVQTADESPTSGSGDIFLDLPAQDKDVENLILHRGHTAFVILNRYPYTSGHLMVAPYRQTAELESLSDDELLEINHLVSLCVRLLKNTHKPDGFNIGINLGRAAGAGIPVHIHWHVVPRWSGDTNFMTTVGDVRVIPQDMPQAYAQLRHGLQGLL